MGEKIPNKKCALNSGKTGSETFETQKAET